MIKKYFIVITILLFCVSVFSSAVYDDIIYKSLYDRVRVRDKSGTKSKIIEYLYKDELVKYLNEKSNFTTKVTINNRVLDEPWVFIEKSNGVKGWVYLGLLEKTKKDFLPETYELIDNVISYALEDYGVKAHISVDDIITALGRPYNHDIKRIESIHAEGYYYELHTLFYDGLYIETYDFEDKTGGLKYLSIENDKYKLKYNIKVGDKKEKLISWFGKPYEIDGNLYKYIEERSVLYFLIKNDKIVKIEMSWIWD